MYAIGGWAVDILYVTERAVFVLGDDGPLLVEVAPGWTAEQVTALMDFRPKFAEHIRPMSALLFAESRRAATADPTPPHHDAQGLID
jgi:acyl CoA:acetate/3-ketoacid CoA transferase